MRLLSEYMSEDEKRVAKVFAKSEKEYVVIVRDNLGNHYNTMFTTMRIAEDYAENWVTNYE